MRVLGHTSVSMAKVYARLAIPRCCATIGPFSVPAPLSLVQRPKSCAMVDVHRCRRADLASAVATADDAPRSRPCRLKMVL